MKPPQHSSSTAFRGRSYLAGLATSASVGVAILLLTPRLDPVLIIVSFALAGIAVVGFVRLGLLFSIPYLILLESAMGWSLNWQGTPQPQEGLQGLLQLQQLGGILIGVHLAIFLLLAFVSSRRLLSRGAWAWTDYETSMFLFFVLGNIVSGAVGLLNRNPSVYILSDVYKLLLIPATYLLVRQTVKSDHAASLLTVVVLCQFVSNNLFLLYFRLRSEFQGDLTRYGGPVLLPFVYFMFRYLHERDTRKRRLYLVLFLGCVFVIAATNSRRAWIMAAAAFPLLFVVRADKRTAFKRLVSLGGAVITLVLCTFLLAPFLGTQGIVDDLVSDTRSKFVDETFVDGQLGQSGRGKVFEVGQVLNETVFSGSTVRALAGNGNGAQFYGYDPESPWEQLYADTGFMVHNVHNGYAAVLFRMGAVGLGLFCVFLFSLFRAVRSTLSRRSGITQEQRVVVEVLLVYFLLVVLLEVHSIGGIIGQLYWGVLIGIFGTMVKQPEAIAQAVRHYPQPIRSQVPANSM